MKTSSFLKFSAVCCMLVLSNCKKDKKTEPDPGGSNNNNNNSSAKYALIIDNGAQSVEVGKTISFSAHLVSATGAVINAGNVSWSSNVGGISGANFSLNTDTCGVISASIQYEGVTYSASVPINVQPIKSTQVFAVVPGAIAVPTIADPIQLEGVYLGGSATYAFSSDNSNIASVSSTGLVTFKSAGSTVIKVTATINGQPSIVKVPVLVVGVPEVPLPVTRITLSPALGEMFRGETLQLIAKAFNSKGEDVTNTVTFNYNVIPKTEEDGNPAVAVSVNGSGLVTANSIGNAYIQVSASGLIAQSEIIVNPDTVIMVTPFFKQLGGFDPITMQPNPTSQVFTATTYKVDRQAYRSGQSNFLNTISNPAGLQWSLPETGIPQIDDMYKVVTLSNASNTSVTATTIPGKAGSSCVVAHAGYLGGAAAVLVMP
jgi:hypothetical protein